jgi:hypothetical protein
MMIRLATTTSRTLLQATAGDAFVKLSSNMPLKAPLISLFIVARERIVVSISVYHAN